MVTWMLDLYLSYTCIHDHMLCCVLSSQHVLPFTTRLPLDALHLLTVTILSTSNLPHIATTDHRIDVFISQRYFLSPIHDPTH